MSVPVNWRIEEVSSATSSSDLARASIDDATANNEGQVFIVGEQTAGRGRSGRRWISKPGDGLYMSSVIRPKRERIDWPSLSFVASLSVSAAIEDLAPTLDPKLKWPNDILIDGKKLGGILLEAYGDYVIIGCGLNLKNAPQLDGADWQATDLESNGAGDITPRAFAEAILDRLSAYYQIWQDAGSAPLLARWQDKAEIIGRELCVRLTDTTISGCCESLGSDGSLKLRDGDDRLHHITAGDVLVMGELDAARH